LITLNRNRDFLGDSWPQINLIRKLSLEVEVKDDTKDNSYESVGLFTYSNSESTVWTHASIFETLWIRAEIEEKERTPARI